MTKPALPFFVVETDSPAKRAILTSALDLFASKGVDGVSIRDIAAEAGFSNPAMFRHFTSKDDLARKLFEACYSRLAATLGPLAEHRADSMQVRLAEMLRLVEMSPDSVHFVLENMRRYWRELPDEVRRVSILGAMRRLVEREQQAGRVNPKLDPSLVSALVLGVLAQIARMAHFNELPRPASALANDLWALIDHGIGL